MGKTQTLCAISESFIFEGGGFIFGIELFWAAYTKFGWQSNDNYIPKFGGVPSSPPKKVQFLSQMEEFCFFLNDTTGKIYIGGEDLYLCGKTLGGFIFWGCS